MGILILCLICGILIYRGSGKLWNALLGGIALPFIGLVVSGSVMGKALFLELNPEWLFISAILGIAFLVWIFGR